MMKKLLENEKEVRSKKKKNNTSFLWISFNRNKKKLIYFIKKNQSICVYIYIYPKI